MGKTWLEVRKTSGWQLFSFYARCHKINKVYCTTVWGAKCKRRSHCWGRQSVSWSVEKGKCHILKKKTRSETGNSPKFHLQMLRVFRIRSHAQHHLSRSGLTTFCRCVHRCVVVELRQDCDGQYNTVHTACPRLGLLTKTCHIWLVTLLFGQGGRLSWFILIFWGGRLSLVLGHFCCNLKGLCDDPGGVTPTDLQQNRPSVNFRFCFSFPSWM